MESLVQSVLDASAEKESKYKTTEVSKDIDVYIDEGHLLAVDPNPLDVKLLRSKTDSYLKDLARDNIQLLANKIWELPVERVDDVIVAKLPDPRTIVPREKPLPKEKPVTKWADYARKKGIRKRKKSRMVWDEMAKEWKPRWGYKRANDDTKDWLIEVPDNADPYEDQFAKRIEAKKERIAKNELQRLRNIARHMKGKIPGVGLTPTNAPDKDDVSRALHLATKSTASLGKFTKQLPKEKPAKNTGKKRKFDPLIGDMNEEKRRALDILKKISSNQPTLNVTQAANQELHSEEQARAAEKKGKKTPKKGKGKHNQGGKGKRKGKGVKGHGKKGKRS